MNIMIYLNTPPVESGHHHHHQRNRIRPVFNDFDSKSGSKYIVPVAPAPRKNVPVPAAPALAPPMHGYTGCVIIIDAFLVCSPARIVIGSQTVGGYRRDPRRPGHLVGEE